MKKSRIPSPDPISEKRIPRSHPLPVLAVAIVSGASLLGVRRVVRGDADPFSVDWPLDLILGSLALTLSIAFWSRRPILAAFGIYCGLVGYMLVDGNAEYPAASVIALTVHGLLPALLGALLAAGIQFAVRSGD